MHVMMFICRPHVRSKLYESVLIRELHWHCCCAEDRRVLRMEIRVKSIATQAAADLG